MNSGLGRKAANKHAQSSQNFPRKGIHNMGVLHPHYITQANTLYTVGFYVSRFKAIELSIG